MRIRRKAVRTVCSRIYRDTDRDYNRSVVVAGAGRSGTTWISELVSSQGGCRVMFEPFNWPLVAPESGFRYFQYQRPGTDNARLEAYVRRVLTGQIRNRWIDKETESIRPRFRLIKAIRANFFLKWMAERFVGVPLLLVIRHPCAVVASRMELGWDADGDIQPLLEQDDFVSDFIGDKLHWVRGLQRDEEKHAVVWSLNNIVPLQQFCGQKLGVCHYEKLLTEPRQEIPKIFTALNQHYREDALEKLKVTSRTTRPSRMTASTEDRLGSWRSRLTEEQVRRVLEVVVAFGLDWMYGTDSMPLRDAATRSDIIRGDNEQ